MPGGEATKSNPENIMNLGREDLSVDSISPSKDKAKYLSCFDEYLKLLTTMAICLRHQAMLAAPSCHPRKTICRYAAYE